jgi:EmrB/QacA subfamily drug resistance transporter
VSTTSPERTPVASESSHHPTVALVVIATAQLMVMLDLTIVNIALPAIQHALGFSLTGLSWVIDAYVLAFGGLLLFGGRTGDLFGRRTMLIAGIALFTLASLAGGLATSQTWLIAARTVQGLGAAIASPTALSLIVTTFPEGHARHRAMAIYAAMSGAGGALGLLLGGALVDAASWRWVFFVNVPIGLALIVLAPLALPRGQRTRSRLDLPGALLITASMTALVYGLERAPSVGWSSATTLLSFAVALVGLVTFGVVEQRSRGALVPLDFLVHHGRAVGYAMMFLLGGAMLSTLYFLTQFLQNVLHYSPIHAGLAYLPLPFSVAIFSQVVSRLVGRFGVRPFLTVGPLLVVAGLSLASSLNATSTYAPVFAALTLLGVGMGLSFVPLTLNAVASVGNRQAGLASGLLNTSQQLGGSVALAALVSVAATATRHSLAQAATSTLTPSHSTQLAAEVHGFQSALHGGVLAAALAFVMALFLPRTSREAVLAVTAPSLDPTA